MAAYVDRKMLLGEVIKVSRETCSIYDKLMHKSIRRESKNIFIKMHIDETKVLESYESMYSSLPDDGNCGRSFETELPAYFDMFKHIKVKLWCTREDALTLSESIEHIVISYLTKLKDMFPGLADDIIDGAISYEKGQLKFLFDVHYLQLTNNIMI